MHARPQGGDPDGLRPIYVNLVAYRCTARRPYSRKMTAGNM